MRWEPHCPARRRTFIPALPHARSNRLPIAGAHTELLGAIEEDRVTQFSDDRCERGIVIPIFCDLVAAGGGHGAALRRMVEKPAERSGDGIGLLGVAGARESRLNEHLAPFG